MHGTNCFTVWLELIKYWQYNLVSDPCIIKFQMNRLFCSKHFFFLLLCQGIVMYFCSFDYFGYSSFCPEIQFNPDLKISNTGCLSVHLSQTKPNPLNPYIICTCYFLLIRIDELISGIYFKWWASFKNMDWFASSFCGYTTGEQRLIFIRIIL